MTTLIFIRHAMSEGNHLGVCSGQLDYPLVEEGFSQAERTAVYLREHYSIDAIYASDLCRTVQTARPTADAFGLEIVTDRRLREACVGAWEGQKWKELEQKYPQIFPFWMRFQMDRSDPRPEGAECREEIVERVEAAIRDIVITHPDQCVAIFCHGRMLRALSDTWKEKSPALAEEMKQRNIKGFQGCSVTVAEYDNEARFIGVPLCHYRGFLQEAPHTKINE